MNTYDNYKFAQDCVKSLLGALIDTVGGSFSDIEKVEGILSHLESARDELEEARKLAERVYP